MQVTATQFQEELYLSALETLNNSNNAVAELPEVLDMPGQNGPKSPSDNGMSVMACCCCCM